MRVNKRHGQLNIYLRRKRYKIDYVIHNTETTGHIGAILSHGGGWPANHGGNLDHGCLSEIADECAVSGLPCMRYTFNNDNFETGWFDDETRYDFTYRLRRDAMRAVLIAVKKQPPPEMQTCERFVMGGFSWSANAATELSLQRQDIVGLLLLSYDFHRAIFRSIPLEKIVVPAFFAVGELDDVSVPVIPHLPRIAEKNNRILIVPDAERKLEVRTRDGWPNESATRKATMLITKHLEMFLSSFFPMQ